MKPTETMTLKDWIITLVFVFIPIVGLVMLIIWAVDKENPRSLFSKAYLIVSASIFAIVIGFYILMMILMLVLSYFITTAV